MWVAVAAAGVFTLFLVFLLMCCLVQAGRADRTIERWREEGSL